MFTAEKKLIAMGVGAWVRGSPKTDVWVCCIKAYCVRSAFSPTTVFAKIVVWTHTVISGMRTHISIPVVKR